MIRADANTIAVSAAEVGRNFGEWQARAIVSPVTITHHGRARLILSSVDAFQRRDDAAVLSDGPPPATRKASTQFRAVLGQLREGFVAYDADLRVVDINPTAELYLGVTRDEILGHRLMDLRPETERSIAWDYFRRVIRTSEPTEFRTESAVNPSSKISVRAFPYDGGVAVLFTNVTSAEDARLLEEWQASFRAAIALDPTKAVIILNTRGGVHSVDDAFVAMTGFSEEQLVKLLLTEIAHPSERVSLAHAINLVIRERQPAAFTMTCLNRDGADRRLRLNMSPAPEDATSNGLIAFVSDLSKSSEANS